MAKHEITNEVCEMTLLQLQEFANQVKDLLVAKLVSDGVIESEKTDSYIVLLKRENSFGKLFEKFMPSYANGTYAFVTKVDKIKE